MSFSINPGLLTDKLNSVWDEFYYGVDGGKSIRDRLHQSYYDIQDAAGAQAKIIVAGYPKLLDPMEVKFYLMREMLLSLMIP